jgi:hypothetical protein
MAIGIRSPFFISHTQSGGASAVLTLTVNGSVVYTINKETGASFLADISDLVRDYIEPTYDGTLDTDSPDVATVSYSVQFYDANLLALGDPKTGDSPYSAYDGYRYFSEGNNFSFNNRVLLSASTIWLPENTAGTFYKITSDSLSTVAVGTSATSVEGIAVKRFDCSRFTPVKVVFINKFGVPQELCFFGKTIEATSASKQFYKSNISAATGLYDPNKHQMRSFDVNGKTNYTLNTGFVGEEYNEFVREMMLSEQVWAVIDGTIRPVTPTSSEVTFRTSLNDKLVEYSVDFEQANDLIADVR